MKSDIDIKRDVEEELRLNPDLDATDVAVAVKSGVVSLSGFVRSYSQRWEAERTAKRVNGVTGVANDIEVRLPVFNQRPDPEIARDAVSAVQSELPYSSAPMIAMSRAAISSMRSTAGASQVGLSHSTQPRSPFSMASESKGRLAGFI